jgi:hypothetical protein
LCDGDGDVGGGWCGGITSDAVAEAASAIEAASCVVVVVVVVVAAGKKGTKLLPYKKFTLAGFRGAC